MGCCQCWKAGAQQPFNWPVGPKVCQPTGKMPSMITSPDVVVSKVSALTCKCTNLKSSTFDLSKRHLQLQCPSQGSVMSESWLNVFLCYCINIIKWWWRKCFLKFTGEFGALRYKGREVLPRLRLNNLMRMFGIQNKQTLNFHCAMWFIHGLYFRLVIWSFSLNIEKLL